MTTTQKAYRAVNKPPLNRKSWNTIMLTVLGIFFTVVMIFPLYWVIVSSLKNTTELFSTPPRFFPHQIELMGVIYGGRSTE